MYTFREIEAFITRDDLSIREKEVLNDFIDNLTEYERDCFIECFRDFNISTIDLAIIYNTSKQEIVRTIAELGEKLVNRLNREVRLM